MARELSQDDVLHASYSRNMARESMKKALLKFAKDKGVNDAEIWSHGDQWAMRFTNADGEPRMALIGDVFAKARGTILSLAKPRVAMSSNNSLASQIAQLQKRYPKVQFSPAPNGGIKVRSDSAVFVAKDINAVISRLGKAMSLAAPKKAAKKATKPTPGGLTGLSADWFMAQGIKSREIAEKAAATTRQGVDPMQVLRFYKRQETTLNRPWD